jgi:membrane fusion protein (multidrug efflux system)
MKVKYISSITIFSAMMMALLPACSSDPAPGGNPGGGQGSRPITESQGVIVQPQKIEDIATTTGTLLPNEEVEVRPEMAGRITRIGFSEGQLVRQGQLLIQLDDAEIAAQLNKLKVEEAQAMLEEERGRKMLEIKAISQEAYDALAYRLQNIEAERALIQVRLDRTRVLAPFTGIVGFRNVSPGSYISSADAIASIRQLNPIKLDFTLPERYASAIKPGNKVEFQVNGMDNIMQAEVYALETAIETQTRAIRIRARAANPNNLLIPGSFARVNLVLSTTEDALMVPSHAVVPVLEGQKVFVLRDGKAEGLLIETGLRTESDVEIRGGLLQPGDTVITTGLMSIVEGAQIKVNVVARP